MQRLKLVDGMARGRLSRREFARALGVFGLTTAVMPLARRRARAGGKLLYFTWSGYENPSLFPGYAEKRGAPDVTFYGDEYEATVKLKAGYEADIVSPCINVMPRWFDAGLRPIDDARLLYLGEQFDRMRELDGSHYDGQRYFVPTNWGTSGFIYRPDLTDITPADESWMLLFDERFKGRIATWDSTDAVIPSAALALGYGDDPYRPSGERLAQVGALLRKQRPLLRFYWTDVSELEQAFAAGEVLVSFAWHGAAVRLAKSGVPVVYATPKEGIMGWICGLARGHGQADDDAAYDFINASMTAEAGAFLITAFGYGSPNRKAYDLVPAETLAALGLSDPENTLNATHTLDFVPPELKQQHFELFDDVKAGA